MIGIRPTRLDDAAGIARVRAESWRAAYRGIVPDDFLDAIDVDDWSRRQRRNMENEPPGLISLVAEEAGLIVGWAAFGKNRQSESRYAGELYTVYVLPSHWRRGIGTLLMEASAQSLIASGMNSMILWVLAGNRPARSFYETLGGACVEERVINIGGVDLPEAAYGWDDLTPLANPDTD